MPVSLAPESILRFTEELPRKERGRRHFCVGRVGRELGGASVLRLLKYTAMVAAPEVTASVSSPLGTVALSVWDIFWAALRFSAYWGHSTLQPPRLTTKPSAPDQGLGLSWESPHSHPVPLPRAYS